MAEANKSRLTLVSLCSFLSWLTKIMIFADMHQLHLETIKNTFPRQHLFSRRIVFHHFPVFLFFLLSVTLDDVPVKTPFIFQGQEE